MAGIRKTFNRDSVNERVVFTDFSLTLDRGSFVSVVGSNGSGKTTLLNVLCGSIPQDGGTVEIAGKNIDKLREHERSRFIGRVFQDPSKGTCASLTILENMALADNKGRPYWLGRGVPRKRTDVYRGMLEPLGLGLENQMNVTVGSLSGGQRQALALLISVMTPLELLILDEHTAALDPRSSETVMELTERVVREKRLTTLMVTHNLRFAVGYASRLIMLHQGGVTLDAARGGCSVEDLLARFNEISIETGNGV
ncbi:MAG: ATP-binding cassette domain-containing protein [Oscillospiraceae bacterium]|jgi:putative ABC transport system ATP-binding protein|nr:ATP-binding cassette domain-containing protein [Oscillospiraceae bacterium]